MGKGKKLVVICRCLDIKNIVASSQSNSSNTAAAAAAGTGMIICPFFPVLIL